MEGSTMWFASWSQILQSHSPRTPRHQRRRKQCRRPSFVPRLEFLENRTVPSTLVVTSATDSGPGSLRDTIAAAHSGDTIVFDPSLDGQTIILTSGEVAFNQSLSIRGLGADHLTISGNGTSRVFDLTGSGANITIANLAIA